jgi:hypothetical protein
MLTFKQFVQEALTRVKGTQYGSNEGGVHVDSDTGEKYYVKHYENPDQAKSEVLAGKIYDHMGIKTLNPEYREIDGRPSVVTKWNDDLSQLGYHGSRQIDSDQANEIGKMYHGAILTKNWDIVGQDYDNITKNSKGDLHAIDHGGTFEFRAQGGHKNYDRDIGEHQSLRNDEEASGDLFNRTFKTHRNAERNGLDSVRNMNDDHIHSLFANSGLSNWEQLHSNFMEKKKKLLARYGH